MEANTTERWKRVMRQDAVTEAAAAAA